MGNQAGVLHFGVEEGQEVIGKQVSEWVGQARVRNPALIDVDGLEDGLVEMSPSRPIEASIQLLWIAEELQCLREVVLDVLPVEFGLGERGTGVGELLGHALLLVLEQVERDRASEVGLKQLATLGFELHDSSALSSGFQLSRLGLLAHRGAQLGADGLDGLLAEADAAVVGVDLILDGLRGDVGQGAVLAAFMASLAEEVVVRATAAA